MKLSKNIIAIYLSICVSIMCILTGAINVKAEHGGSGGEISGDDVFQSGASGYTMNDDSSIPSGMHFFYRYADGKAWYCSINDGLSVISNKALGISFNLSVLSSLVSGFSSYVTAYTGQLPKPESVLKGGNGVGYALNSLQGCRIVNPEESNDVEISSDTNNFIYVYVNEYLKTQYPDYIIFKPFNKSEITQISNVTGNMGSQNIEIINSLNNTDCVSYIKYNSATNIGIVTTTSSPNNTYYKNSIRTGSPFVSILDSGYQNICAVFGLKTTNYELTAQEVFDAGYNSTELRVQQQVNGNLENIDYTSYIRQQNALDGTWSDYTTTGSNYLVWIGGKKQTIYGQTVTIYRTAQIAQQVVNNTYAPTINKSNTYYNYDSTSTTNNITVTTQQIPQGQTTNNNIYNQQSESYQEGDYYEGDNYNIDNSQVNTNNTTIINNYYGDNSGGGSGGEGGGGSGEEGGGDSPVWDALISALLAFFARIAELIGAIITGLLGILTSVLDAISNITTDFSGVTDFLSQIFGFLPTEIISVLILGATLGVLISLIKMLGK